jgi:putative transposase
MALLSYRRHRFPPEIIQHAIWLYLRFTLSYRDVEELLAERGLDMAPSTWRALPRLREQIGVSSRVG